MIYLIPTFLLGMLVGWLIMRWELNCLKVDKQTLLDFNERLIRDREDLDQRYLMISRGYIAHLDKYECVEKEEVC